MRGLKESRDREASNFADAQPASAGRRRSLPCGKSRSEEARRKTPRQRVRKQILSARGDRKRRKSCGTIVRAANPSAPANRAPAAPPPSS